MKLAPDVIALSDEHAYVAAFEELDGLALSEADTPPGRRFEELVRMIEEYDALRGGYLLLPRAHRTAGARRATNGSPSGAPDDSAQARSVEFARAGRR